MRVRFVGSGDAFGSGGRWQTCIHFSRRSTPLQVAGPPGIRTRLAEAMEALFPGSSQAQRRFPVEVTELRTDGKAAGLGAATVRGWEVEHACGAPAQALRVELGGTSFA